MRLILCYVVSAAQKPNRVRENILSKALFVFANVISTLCKEAQYSELQITLQGWLKSIAAQGRGVFQITTGCRIKKLMFASWFDLITSAKRGAIR
jgi:hypothetical protein